MKGIKKSLIRQFTEKAARDSINLGLGQLEFELPEEVKQAAVNALENGYTKYSPNAGFMELREAVAADCNRARKTEYSAQDVIINSGTEQALFAALLCTINPGDKVIVLEPAYPAYESILSILGAKTVPAQLTEEFKLDMQKLEKETKNVKVMVVNFPNNPTGAILSKKQSQELAVLAEKNKFILVSDEVYSALYYEEPSVSPASFSDRTIILDGISKRASATGLRIGWTIAPKELAASLEAANQYITTCASSVSQMAALAAIKHSGKYVDGFRKELWKRRDIMLEEFRKWNIGKSVEPRGAFYFFPDLSEFGSGLELADKIIANGVSVVPGEAFGRGGAGHIRLSFCASPEQIRKGMRKIMEVIRK